MKIDVGNFTISRRQKELIGKVLESERLSYGDMTQRFEKEWAKLHDVKYAMFCNSGTSALQVAIHALKDKYKWQDNDEVIIPALTFVATMNVVLHNNMKPVFVDVDRYLNIDPDLIERAITKKTRAIVVVHLLGQPAQMDKIMKIARKHKLKVVEDSCETVAATYAGKKVGSWGDVACFSTYASHLVVTGVGGMAVTNNSDIALRIRGLFNHGRDGVYNSMDDNKKGTQIMKSRFNFVHSGYSYRLTELESALGIGHLERFDKELEKRRANADFLIESLDELELSMEIVLPYIHPKATHSWMLFPIIVGKNVDRDKFIKYLEKKGIATRYVMPLLSQPITKDLFGDRLKDFPVTDLIHRKGFLIGVHQELTKKDLQYIVKTFKEYFNE